MIWANVSSQSCCWLYRASPFLAAKNIINLIPALTVWWCSCVESSLVLLQECLLWPVCSYPLSCFVLYFKTKFACYSRCFLTSYFCIPVPYNEKDIFLGVLALEGLVGPHRIIQFQVLQHYWSGHRLVFPWYWMVCLRNKQRLFCRLWDCIQVLYLGLFCWLWWLLHFF